MALDHFAGHCLVRKGELASCQVSQHTLAGIKQTCCTAVSRGLFSVHGAYLISESKAGQQVLEGGPGGGHQLVGRL